LPHRGHFVAIVSLSYLGRAILASSMFEILSLAILIYSVVLHEVSHGLAARAMGDYTAQQMGRLTLNPLKHLDMFGSFILPIITYLAAGFMFGYAKPVPYNPRNLNDHRWGPAKVGLAGPATNIIIALICGLAIRMLGFDAPQLAIQLLFSAVIINLSLAIFNLMPVPPLDGHWLLMALLPAGSWQLRATLYRFQWALLAFSVFVLFPLVSPLIMVLAKLFSGV